MRATKEKLLAKLPEYRDEWLLIHPDQKVSDIITEVLEAHDEFAPMYDKIVLFFEGDNTEQLCNDLFDFCRDNIEYREETEDDQTSALPTGILTRGFGDCKHYAGFCGGVLDALNRRGAKIRWKYRFASYDLFDRTPHHVFIVVNDNGNEIWIDPTPGSENKIPTYYTDKKIAAPDMALRRNIAGIYPESVGMVIQPFSGNTIDYDGTGKYNGVFSPYLGLHDYAEYESSSGTDFGALASAINALIEKGPSPGHQVDAAFVQWVFDNNIRSWNFYYPAGVAPGFAEKSYSILPSTWPKPKLTADGRLIFDRSVEVDDYHNPEIHILTAALQDAINRYDPKPYPLKPRDVKLFSQEHTDMSTDSTANLFSERRGTSDLAKAVSTLGPLISTAAKFFGIPVSSDQIESWVNGLLGSDAGQAVMDAAGNIDFSKLANTALSSFFPGKNATYSNGALFSGSQQIPLKTSPGQPELIKYVVIPAGVALGVYFLVNAGKKGRKKNIIAPIGAGAGTALVLYMLERQAINNQVKNLNPSPMQPVLPSSDSGALYASADLTAQPVDTSGGTGIVKDYNDLSITDSAQYV